jgi:hypothetical protein
LSKLILDELNQINRKYIYIQRITWEERVRLVRETLAYHKIPIIRPVLFLTIILRRRSEFYRFFWKPQIEIGFNLRYRDSEPSPWACVTFGLLDLPSPSDQIEANGTIFGSLDGHVLESVRKRRSCYKYKYVHQN